MNIRLAANAGELSTLELPFIYYTGNVAGDRSCQRTIERELNDMAKRHGHISRRELLARGIALGGLSVVGSISKLFGQEALSEGAHLPAAAEPLADLRASLRGELLTPTDPAYDEARKLWNGMIDKHPALIAVCADAPDVQNAVTFASERGLLLAVKGGGHSFPGKSVCEGGMMIDLSQIHSVEVDADNQTAVVGGGALLAHLDTATLPHNLATTAGIVSHTGVGGFTLGGGLLSRFPKQTLALLRKASRKRNENTRWNVAMAFTTAAARKHAAEAQGILDALDQDTRKRIVRAVAKARKNLSF